MRDTARRSKRQAKLKTASQNEGGQKNRNDASGVQLNQTILSCLLLLYPFAISFHRKSLVISVKKFVVHVSLPGLESDVRDTVPDFVERQVVDGSRLGNDVFLQHQAELI